MLGPILGPSWGHLGPSWATLAPSWGQLGPSWGPLGAMFGHLGTREIRGGRERKVLDTFWDTKLYHKSGVPGYHESKPKEVHAQNVCRYQKLHGVGRVRRPVSSRTDAYRCASATSSSSLRNATTCWRRRVGAEHHRHPCTLARLDETVSDCRCCGQVMLLATRPRQRQEEQ